MLRTRLLRKHLMIGALFTSLLIHPALLSAQVTGETSVSLADMLLDLGRKPEVLEGVLQTLGTSPTAVGVMPPDTRNKLRAAVLEGRRETIEAVLNRFPRLSVEALGAAVVAYDRAQQRGLVDADGGEQPAGDAGREAPETDPATGQAATGQAVTGQAVVTPDWSPALVREPLGLPTGERGPDASTLYKPLGAGVEQGYPAPAERLARLPDSTRLAEVLNELSTNDPALVTYISTHEGGEARSVRELLEQLKATGHAMRVEDNRAFANFAGLRYQGRDVAAPFWIETGVQVPGTDRTLAVPAVHSEHVLFVRGPKVTAEVKFYMGSDGEARFRPAHNSRPDWTGEWVERVYEGDDAIKAMDVAGQVRRALVEKKDDNPDLPMNGYYGLGVCNDSSAFIEHAMTGRTTVYPLTRDPRLFGGDSAIDRMSAELPNDRHDENPPNVLERVLLSLPVRDLDRLVFSGLRRDVEALLDANKGLAKKIRSTGISGALDGQGVKPRGGPKPLDPIKEPATGQSDDMPPPVERPVRGPKPTTGQSDDKPRAGQSDDLPPPVERPVRGPKPTTGQSDPVDPKQND